MEARREWRKLHSAGLIPFADGQKPLVLCIPFHLTDQPTDQVLPDHVVENLLVFVYGPNRPTPMTIRIAPSARFVPAILPVEVYHPRIGAGRRTLRRVGKVTGNVPARVAVSERIPLCIEEAVVVDHLACARHHRIRAR